MTGSTSPPVAPATVEALWCQAERLLRRLVPRYGFHPQEVEDLAGEFSSA